MLILPIIIVLIFYFINGTENFTEEPHPSEIVSEEEANKMDLSITEKHTNIEKTEKKIIERKDKPIIKKPIIANLDKVKDIDFSVFKPSYNLLVSNALIQEHKDLNNLTENDNWSLDFINSLISKTNKRSKDFISINTYKEYDKFQEYITAQETYYIGNKSCLPLVGDFVLYDNDSDGIVDNISIITEYVDYKITDIAGNRWCEEHQKFEVLSETKFLSNEKILGIYRPQYNITRLEKDEHINLPMNAVDTVVSITEEEHVKILAENGIKVFARYINPEGRTPLTLEDVKLFSKYGIRTMMIYQINTSDPYKGYDKGIEFGTKALEYARALEAPTGTPIFFCCDCPSDFNGFGKVAEFINGVKDVFKGEYSVGLYGGYYVNEAMYNLGLIDAYWQCWGLSDRYISNNYDIMQWSSGHYYFEGIPYLFDANYVKNPEKVSYILEDKDGRTEELPILQRDGEKIFAENR